MPRKIYIIRHGETDYNKYKKFQGQSDVPLNDEGRRQAERLAGALADAGALPFDRIVSSDLSRAVETAEIMTKGFPTPVSTDARLREMNFGGWEGLAIDAIRARWPQELEDWFTRGILNIPGGETQEQLYDRVWASFREWAAREDYRRMAIVFHGGSSGALICALTGKPASEMSRFMLKNTGICVATEEGGGKYRLDLLTPLMYGNEDSIRK